MKSTPLPALLGIAALTLLALPAQGAVLADYDFTAGATTSTDTNTDSLASSFTKNISNASFSTDGLARISASYLTATSASDSVTKGEYYSFTLTPGSGNAINLTSLTFDTAFYGTAAAGPYYATYFVRSSLDGYAATIGSNISSTVFQSTATAPTLTGATVDLSDSAYQSISGTVTFRIYVYDGNLTSSTRFVALDNVILNGTVSTSPVPEPSTYALLTGVAGLLAAGFRRRRGY